MKRQRWTKDELKRVQRLSDFGYNDAEIAKNLGRTESSVNALRRQKRIVTINHKMGIVERLFYLITKRV